MWQEPPIMVFVAKPGNKFTNDIFVFRFEIMEFFLSLDCDSKYLMTDLDE